MALGMVVLGALFSLVTATGRATARTSDRVDASQRGRTVMGSVIQQLRSSVCLPVTVPVPGYVQPYVVATPTTITWYSNIDSNPAVDQDGDGDPTYDPQQRRLTYVPMAGATPSRLVEERWNARPPIAAGTPASQTRTILTHLEPVSGTGPFSYGAYTADPADKEPSPFVPGVLERIVRVDVGFRVRPTSGNLESRRATTLRSSAYARVIDRTVDTANPFPTYGCTT